MIKENRIKEAQANFKKYLEEGLVKKESNATAQAMYAKNSDMSILVAEKLMKDENKPYLWVIVCSYYSMFYIANSVLHSLGYRNTGKIAHKVTSDSLIVLVMDKLKKELLEEYEDAMEEALELASLKAETVIHNFELERTKRAQFQYNMTSSAQEQKAKTSLQRAKEFSFEMKKLIKH
jgi:uncharacterized protein (UPF0332 family)